VVAPARGGRFDEIRDRFQTRFWPSFLKKVTGVLDRRVSHVLANRDAILAGPLAARGDGIGVAEPRRERLVEAPQAYPALLVHRDLGVPCEDQERLGSMSRSHGAHFHVNADCGRDRRRERGWPWLNLSGRMS
jgi:hypothetical protein